MTYLSSLPKDLQNLLDHYVNHEYWQSLSGVFHEIDRCRYYATCCASKDEYIQMIERLMQSLPTDIKHSLNTEEVESVGVTSVSLKLHLPIDMLITRESLLCIFDSICVNLYPHLLNIMSKINDVLEKNNYKERWVLMNYSEHRSESKMVAVY